MKSKAFRLLTPSFLLTTAAAIGAELPIPFHASDITKTSHVAPGMVVRTTKDSPEQACAWYRKNLKNPEIDSKTEDGGCILRASNGAGVAVHQGPSFDPGTTVGLLSWNPNKFGDYKAP